MHVHQLHAFLAVAQEQSFRRAAAVLCTSQPTVSAQIADLEHHLGVKLFDRDRGGTRLTADGFDLVPVARAAVAAVAQVELAAARSPRYRRRFTVGLLPAGLGTLAWPLMRTFHDARPELDLHVRQVTFGTALPLLHAGAIDVLGAVGPFGDADGHVTTVGHVPTIGVLAAHHPDADADVLPLDWIAPRLTSRPPDGMGEAWGKFWTLEDLSGRPRDRLRLLDPDADIAALLHIISSGLVGIWPAGIPADIPGVVTIPLDPVPQAPLQLVTTRPVHPDVAQFLDIAQRLAATEPASLP